MDPLVLIPMIAATLATGLGEAPIHLVRGLSSRAQGTIIAFAAGVMLAVVPFDLLPDAARLLDGDLLKMGATVLAGAALILAVHVSVGLLGVG